MTQPRFPQPGDLFAGRYRIDSVIGSGGFARVFRATQTDLGRQVAVKILSRGVLTKNDATIDRDRARSASKRFRREAQLVSQLRDPHTVTVYDYGESEDGLLYIVFELIDGYVLKDIVYGGGPMAPERVVAVLRKVLSSLREAHDLGILHRDIKPTNIMLFEHMGREEVKLLDFGVAKASRESREGDEPLSELTREGSLIGTPRYMAPEQIRTKAAGPTSDIFSLGMVAYEMLTAEQANGLRSPVAVLGRQLDDEPFVLPGEAPIPAGLRQIIHTMLQKDPAYRYQTASEVLTALENWNATAEDLAPTFQFLPPTVVRDPTPHPAPSLARARRDSPPPDDTPNVPVENEAGLGRILALLIMLGTLGAGLGAAVYYATEPPAAEAGKPDPSPAPAAPVPDESNDTVAAVTPDGPEPSKQEDEEPEEPVGDPVDANGADPRTDEEAPKEQVEEVEEVETSARRKPNRRKRRHKNRPDGKLRSVGLDEGKSTDEQPPTEFFGLDQAE